MTNKERIAKLARDIDKDLKAAHATMDLRAKIAARIGEVHGQIKEAAGSTATNAWGRE